MRNSPDSPDSSDEQAADVVEQIYDAFDAGEYPRALDLAQATLVGLKEDDPVLRFLAGAALMEMGRLADASVPWSHDARRSGVGAVRPAPLRHDHR